MMADKWSGVGGIRNLFSLDMIVGIARPTWILSESKVIRIVRYPELKWFHVVTNSRVAGNV